MGDYARRIVLLDLDGETLRLILYLKDGTNLRVTEQWQGELLKRYSYYWLTSENELKIGWDNAPHHTEMDSFPHHKHVSHQNNIVSSDETCLEDVMEYVLSNIDH
jgi:hypothetical protein